MEWVPIRNIIGGAAEAHIPMTLGLSPTSCEFFARNVTGGFMTAVDRLIQHSATFCLP